MDAQFQHDELTTELEPAGQCGHCGEFDSPLSPEGTENVGDPLCTRCWSILRTEHTSDCTACMDRGCELCDPSEPFCNACGMRHELGECDLAPVAARPELAEQAESLMLKLTLAAVCNELARVTQARYVVMSPQHLIYATSHLLDGDSILFDSEA